MQDKHGQKKKKGGIIYTIIIIILIGVIGFSLYKIGTILYGYWKGQQTYNEVARIAEVKEKKKSDDIKLNWDKLLKKYPDIRAWLYCKGTKINYPVVQGEDNDYYLHRMITGEWNGAGTLFIDYRHASPFRGFLTIIYGHHMRDGSMFGELVKYREKDYYEKHKEMKLYTPYNKFKLKIIGVCTIPAKSERYNFDLVSDAEKDEYIQWIKSASETEIEETATPRDHIVMLSTCTYEYDNARCVVFGKLVK